jgi:exodeoxyribonuclease V alpha subunit
VTFYNDETDFAIARLKVSGYRDLVTVVGTLMAPTPGQVVRATGEWINHPKFGEHSITHTPRVINSCRDREYLGSGLIKGIGPVMAKRMVKLDIHSGSSRKTLRSCWSGRHRFEG